MALVNELRIGNFIRVKSDNTIVPEFKHRIDQVTSKMFELIECVDYYEPIPLTEEILMKCGFKRADSDNGFMLPIINEWTFLYADIVYSYFELSVSSHSCQLDFKYVHQLQNLYFALTGQELTVQL